MFARLAFAVAINVEPDILIVDEALSVGDIFFQAKCYQKFMSFKEAGKTILFVTHDLSSVIKYCDRTILIDKGNQVMVGPSAEVVNVYKKILVNQYTQEAEEEKKEEAKVSAASIDNANVGLLTALRTLKTTLRQHLSDGRSLCKIELTPQRVISHLICIFYFCHID